MSLAQPNEVSERMDRVVRSLHLSGCGYKESLREFRRAYLARTPTGKRNNQCVVAQTLGLHRNTVGRMVAELGLRRVRKPKPKGANFMLPSPPPPAPDEGAHLKFRAEVRAVYPDAMIHTDLTREKTVLFVCVSPAHYELAKLKHGEIESWLSCWRFSPADAWEDAARRLRETQEHA